MALQRTAWWAPRTFALIILVGWLMSACDSRDDAARRSASDAHAEESRRRIAKLERDLAETKRAEQSRVEKDRTAVESGPAPTAKPSEQSAVSEAKLVASRNSTVFHKPGCEWAVKIASPNKRTFESAAEAKQAGFRACKVCSPDR